jgi:ankyrin repeat protein
MSTDAELQTISGLSVASKSAPSTQTEGVTASGKVESTTNAEEATSDVEEEENPLVVAARDGNTAEVKRLCESGSYSVLDTAEDGVTALHWAAVNNRISTCQYLVEQGAVVDAKGGQLNGTPLHWACRRGLVYIVHYLIQNGADPLRSDVQGYNALHLATHSSNVMLLVYLLHQGLPVDCQDPNGRTALHWAAYQGDALSVDVLLRWGSDVKITDTQGFLPLHWGIVNGSRNSLARLIEEGSDMYAKSSDGKTPHVMAAEMNTTAQLEGALDDCGRFPDGSQKTKYFDARTTNLLCFFTPFILILLGLVLCTFCGPIFGIILTVATLFGSIKLLKTLVLPSLYNGHAALLKSPFQAGIFTGSAFWVTVKYLTSVLPATFASHPILNFFFASIFGLAMYCFFRCMSMDPGYIPKLSGITEQKEVIETLIERGEFDTRHFCFVTYVRKPLRSKFCRQSKRVVARFDHFCPWVWNAIGVRNHRMFVLYVLFLQIGIPLWLALNSAYFGELLEIKRWDPLEFYLVIWISLQLIWITFLSFVQIFQICRSLTTSEAVNLQKYGYMGADDYSSVTLDHSAATASAKSVMNAHGHAAKSPCFSSVLKLLGVDQFVATAGEAIKHRDNRSWKEKNPTDSGAGTNCFDFWFPNGKFDLLAVFEAGKGGGAIGGHAVDYYKLWDFPDVSPNQQQTNNRSTREDGEALLAESQV